MGITIKHATMEYLDSIASVEAECFPPSEAADREAFIDRIRVYSSHFYLLFEDSKLISFIDGFVTDETDLTDEMFECADMHNENGAWQMLFGVNTLPKYRRKGYAGTLIRMMIEDARNQGRKGLVLTAKQEKTAYYAGFGFIDEGITEKSTHGDAVWHQMRITFDKA